MRSVDVLPWIVVFPFLGFLVNGLLYLASHSKLGPADPHSHGGGHDGPGAHDGAAHGAGHGHGHDGHAPIPFQAVHSWVGTLASALSCVTALVAIFLWWGETHGEAGVVATLWTWVPLGEHVIFFQSVSKLSIDVAFRLDALSALMLFFVTFIGSLIHLYSVGYMGHDPGYGRFFSYLNLFMFSMLTLVLGANLPILFVGWEGVGLCSYLLIGYYYDKDFAADAGKKAFVVNRIGDFGFVLGILGAMKLFGTTDFGRMFEMAAASPESYASFLMTAICLALFLGACGKSAQIPLYVWLPDAMAGPTPVSALIHAATMVTAGVYMVTRCNVFFRLSHEWAVATVGADAPFWQLLTTDASYVVAVVGCATAFFAATMGVAQTDIKKVLAYSTVSQLGYMFLGCGVLAFDAGIFHVFTHAWFKACLFLGAGSVIHALSGEQELPKMGGLRAKVPHTFRTMLIATLAIAGVPGLAGFFSKDAILAETFGSHHPVLWVFAVLTAGLTAFYMFRLIRMAFYGEFRGTAEQLAHAHESPWTMTVPLWVLAGGAVLAGWIGVPAFILGRENVWQSFLAPIFPKLGEVEAHHMTHATEWGLMGASVAIAFFGIWLGVTLYRDPYPFAVPEAVAARFPNLYRWVHAKYYVDELYEWLIVERCGKRFSRFLWELDARVVDGAVNGSRHVTVGVSEISSWFDRVFVDGLVNGVADTLQAAWRGYGRLQSGQTQGYALAMAFGVFGLVCAYLILG